MAKTNITQYSATPSSNTDINSINIDENCPASGLNNAIRELMAHLKNVDTGSQALTSPSFTAMSTDTISEKTSANGVSIDSVTLKDGELGTSASLVPINSSSLNGGQFGVYNMIINGNMAINQRNATSGVTSGYFVDRFRLSGCSASAVITSNTPTEFPTAITVSATSGNPIVTQRIESKNVQHLSGKTVTASFYAKNISNATTLYASLQYAGSADNWGSSTTISEQNLGSLSSDWVKYTASWTVPSGGLNGLALNILCAGSSTFTMGVTGVMLQEGSVATPFEHRSFGEELALCQRYFYVLADGTRGMNDHLGSGHYYGASGIYFSAFPPVEMRATPSMITTDATNHYIAFSAGASDHFDTLGLGGSTSRSALEIVSGSSGTSGTVGNPCFLRLGGTSNTAKAHFNAEL